MEWKYLSWGLFILSLINLFGFLFLGWPFFFFFLVPPIVFTRKSEINLNVCPKCGYPLDPAWEYCPNCGTTVRATFQ